MTASAVRAIMAASLATDRIPGFAANDIWGGAAVGGAAHPRILGIQQYALCHAGCASGVG